jgi:endogenous inhibitor of DNA gyrase (YacG/DUF329 family)
LTPKRSGHRYCSKRCQNVATNLRRHPRVERACLECGTPMVPGPVGIKFCQPSHAAAYHRRAYRDRQWEPTKP